jgi:hypothetical protein
MNGSLVATNLTLLLSDYYYPLDASTCLSFV